MKINSLLRRSSIFVLLVFILCFIGGCQKNHDRILSGKIVDKNAQPKSNTPYSLYIEFNDKFIGTETTHSGTFTTNDNGEFSVLISEGIRAGLLTINRKGSRSGNMFMVADFKIGNIGTIIDSL